MWSFPKRFIPTILILAVLAGCGYHFSSTSPIVLPGNHRLLYLDRVTDPTTEAWLEPALRSEIRDEFTRRGEVRWVPREEAETLMRVTIRGYSAGSSFKGRDDKTVRRSVTLILTAEMVDAVSGHVIWTSGEVVVQESFTGDDEREAGHKAVDLAAERLADGLQQTF